MITLAVSLIAVGFLLVMQVKAKSASNDEVTTFEIEIGEPIVEAVSRSSRKYDFQIPLDMQSLDIPSHADKTDALQILLRNGVGKSIAFPWQPQSGIIWMYAGVTDEIDLSFSTFEGRRLSGNATTPANPIEADIAGIVEIYEQILSLAERPRDESHCYSNDLHLTKRPCQHIILATERQSPKQLAATLSAYHDKVDAQYWEVSKNDYSLILNLGQWWFPNGNLAMLRVMPEYDIEAGVVRGKMPFRLMLQVSVKDHFNSKMMRLALSCYDQQSIFPEKMRYSQAQAGQIFHGLYADFFPPVVDGVVVKDKIALAGLDWGALMSSYSNDPESRKHFCDLLQRLEKDAGYEGPFAPRK
ncbi:hypothetical protein ACLBWZ_07805 [Brucellaceae bacterium C25G]